MVVWKWVAGGEGWPVQFGGFVPEVQPVTTSESTEPRRVGKKTQRQAEALRLQAERERAAKQRKLMTIGGAVAGVVLIVGLFVFLALQPKSGGFAGSTDDLGTVMPDLGRDHVNPGQPHGQYNSIPPTSGWHWPNAAEWGIYSDPVPNELQIHNLEHGGIVIQYNCQSAQGGGPLDEAGCTRMRNDLVAIGRRYPSKVIVAPYPSMEYKVAVTAWSRIMTMEQVDESRIKRFVDAFKNKGPEFVPD